MNAIPPGSAARSHSKGRVLCIDDDETIRQVFHSVLAGAGYEVSEAGDGQAGIEAFERDSPELILVDLDMPVTNGLQVLEHISKCSPDTPVIVVSGSDRVTDVIEALRLHAWDYLLKPVAGAMTLLHAVQMNLERARLVQQNKRVRLELEWQLAKIREDEEAGRKVQARLFPPRAWQFGPYRFEHHLVSSMLLSGDFLDYFAVNEDVAAFYCADVAGHGVSSALITVLLKSTINKYHEWYADRGDPIILQPDQLLKRLNKELLAEDLGKHVTIFYGVLDRAKQVLRYANGGQYPPPLLLAETARMIESKGMAVGLFPGAAFRTETLELPPAFRLVIFSDGVLDALPEPGAKEKLERLRGLGTNQGVREFAAAMAANRELPDDITVLSITKGAAL